MLTIRRCEFVKPVILVATVTYFVVAVNNKQIDSLEPTANVAQSMELSSSYFETAEFCDLSVVVELGEL